MKHIIFKYKLDVGSNVIVLPANAKPLKAGVQDGSIYLWVMFDMNELGEEDRHFKVIGTGWEVDLSHADYIDTVFVDYFVWHIFEILEK